MADTKQLPEATMRDIASQVGDRIAEELSSTAEAEPPARGEGVGQPEYVSPLAGVNPKTARFEITETFEVWKLRAGADDQLAGTGEDLVTLAGPTGTYRHQVRLVQGVEEKTVAFAQSYPAANDPNKCVVRDFYFSPLAAQLDKAIGAADQLVPGDAVARLLSLPEFKVEALWFVTPPEAAAPDVIKTLGVIVIAAPPSFKGETLSLLDSTTFIRILSKTRRGMGLRL